MSSCMCQTKTQADIPHTISYQHNVQYTACIVSSAYLITIGYSSILFSKKSRKFFTLTGSDRLILLPFHKSTILLINIIQILIILRIGRKLLLLQRVSGIIAHQTIDNSKGRNGNDHAYKPH